MSQLIRSILIGRPRFGSIFWWLLSGYFLRPLSVEIVVFDIWIVFIFYTKTCFRRPLSHLRGFLISHKMSRNRVSLALRIICGVFFFRSFFALISWNRCFALFSGHQCCKNVELSNENFVKSSFCFVFRHTMLRKRRTVERKSFPFCKIVFFHMEFVHFRIQI